MGGTLPPVYYYQRYDKTVVVPSTLSETTGVVILLLTAGCWFLFSPVDHTAYLLNVTGEPTTVICSYYR